MTVINLRIAPNMTFNPQDLTNSEVISQYIGWHQSEEDVIINDARIIAKNHKSSAKKPVEDQSLIWTTVNKLDYPSLINHLSEEFKNEKCGSTAIIASIDDEGALEIYNVGDSVAYLVLECRKGGNAGEKVVIKLTHDMDGKSSLEEESSRYVAIVDALGGSLEQTGNSLLELNELEVFGGLGNKDIKKGFIRKPECYEYTKSPFRDALNYFLREELGIEDTLENLLKKKEATLVLASDAFAPSKIGGRQVHHYEISLDFPENYYAANKKTLTAEHKRDFVEHYRSNNSLPIAKKITFGETSGTIIDADKNPLIAIANGNPDDINKALGLTQLLNGGKGPKDDVTLTRIYPGETGVVFDGHRGHEVSHGCADFLLMHIGITLEQSAEQQDATFLRTPPRNSSSARSSDNSESPSPFSALSRLSLAPSTLTTPIHSSPIAGSRSSATIPFGTSTSPSNFIEPQSAQPAFGAQEVYQSPS